MPDFDHDIPDDQDALDLDPVDDDEDREPSWEYQWGCCCPDRCLVFGDHQQGECHTAEDADAFDQAMKEAEHGPPPSRIW